MQLFRLILVFAISIVISACMSGDNPGSSGTQSAGSSSSSSSASSSNSGSIDHTACTDNFASPEFPIRVLNKREIANSFADIFNTSAEEFDLLPDFNYLGLDAFEGGQMAEFDKNFYDALVNASLDAVDRLVDDGIISIADLSELESALEPYAQLFFRRELTEEEWSDLKVFAAQSAEGFSANTGLKAAILNIITSPEFLYIAPEIVGNTTRQLTGYELAQRLSLTLWASVPDSALLNAVKAGQLETDAGLRAQITRMMADEKFARFLDNFPRFWLNLDFVGDFVVSNGGISDEQWQQLRADMARETGLFIENIIRQNKPVADIYKANYSYVNSRLAEFYGFDNVDQGELFVKTDFPAASHRTGLLTHGSTLTAMSDGELAPIAWRGFEIWLRSGKKIDSHPQTSEFNQKLGLVVDGLAVDGLVAQSDIRTELDKDAECQECHDFIDEAGWAFSVFDHMGRDAVAGPDGGAVDATGVFAGESFNGPAEFIDLIFQSYGLENVFGAKFLLYSTGRKIENTPLSSDICAIEHALNESTNRGASDVLISLMMSPIFRAIASP